MAHVHELSDLCGFGIGSSLFASRGDVCKHLYDGLYCRSGSGLWLRCAPALEALVVCIGQSRICRIADYRTAISAGSAITAISAGTMDRADNPLKNAPHTAREVMADDWSHGYRRHQAAFPLPFVAASKYWPPVKRVDNVYGDRNLVCTCAPLEAYAEAAE